MAKKKTWMDSVREVAAEQLLTAEAIRVQEHLRELLRAYDQQSKSNAALLDWHKSTKTKG